MQVAAIQTDFQPDHSISQRRQNGLDATKTALADGADFVVLPELWIHGAWDVAVWDGTGETLDGPTITALAELAATHNTPIYGGSVLETTPDGKLCNTAVLIERDGSIAATYQKIHLFGFDEGEAAHLDAGSQAVTGTVTIADRPTVIGLGICYDLRFPELFRLTRTAGAEIIALGAAWPAARLDAWQLLSRARAAENQTHVIATNQAGHQNDTLLAGGSLIADALGTVLVEANASDNDTTATAQIITTTLDLDRQTRFRDKAPFDRDRVITINQPS